MPLSHPSRPYVLPMRDRAVVVYSLVRERLTDLLPRVMRETGIDKKVFPEICPFSLAQALGDDYWPE